MKQRIISAAIGLVVLAVILMFFETWLLNMAISAIAVMALYEFAAATKISQNKVLAFISYMVAAVVPFIPREQEFDLLPVVILPYMFLLFCVLLFSHKTTRVEQAALTFMVSIGVPLALSTAVYLRDAYGLALGMFYVILALGSAWFSDSAAYFTGKAFGKHKLCPNISPNKTVEGAVGGVVVGTGLLLLTALLFQLAAPLWGMAVEVNYIFLLCIAPAATVVGMVGDLSASIVKRQFQIKDFGNIMPGHGGVLDRFDSVLFCAPFIGVAVKLLPIVTVL